MNPEEKLTTAVYKFSEEDVTQIVREYLYKKTGVSGIPFNLGIDEDDNQMCISFWDAEEELSEGAWEKFTESIPEWDEDYSIPLTIFGAYMHAQVWEVKGYQVGYRPQRWLYYVEVNADKYVSHINIHEWGIL